MSGAEGAQLDLRMEKKSEEDGSEQDSVKLALASLFSDPNLQGGSGDTAEGQLNVEDIPEKIRPILLEKWQRLRSNLDSSRPREPGEPAKNAEYYQNIEEKLAAAEAALQAKTAESEEDAKRIEEFHTESGEYRQKLNEVDQENQRMNSEVLQLKEERDRQARELSDMSEVGKRRDQELIRIEEELKTMSEELQKANAAKCDALIRAEDVASKEVSLSYREKRLEDDRELMQQHINTLTEDLHASTEKANNYKREMINKVSQLQTTLDERQGYVRLLEGREEALKGDKEVIQARLDSLCERLKEARDSNTNMEEGYNEEIRAQTNLANLYKAKANDAEEKSSELAKAVEELQGLLKQSSERYGALEDNLEKEKEENKTEFQRRNEAIRALKKELEDANDLIKNLKQRGLTEEGISQLSPAAAAASKLIKSGMSLTQVYSELVSCQEELLNARDENRQLNTYVEQILSDIEERAPAFKRQRDEYEKALETISGLKIELQNEKESHDSERNEVETARRRLSATSKDNERLHKQIKDLNVQVVTLVREVEAARFGRTTKDENLLTSPGGSQASIADGVISERLVSFHDVSELQQKNMELLTVIREMAVNQENAEKQLVEEKTADLKHELDNVVSRVEELREARRRQETLMDNLVVQRDMYKSMAESNAEQLRASPKATSTPGMAAAKSANEQTTPTKGIDKNAFRDLEVRASKAETALAEIRKDFDVYREEKCENEKMITEMLDKTREELNETRAKAIKLASQEEWNTERFRLSQNNASNYKTEIGLLEERNKTLHSVIAKHENSIDALHKELLNSQTSLSKAERSAERIQNENNMLKMAESRLKQECEILHRQKTGSALIAENLKMVQVQIEKGESEAKMRLQNEKDALQKEVSLLRKKLDSEVESFKSSVQAWESSEKELRVQIENMKVKETESKDNLDNTLKDLESTKEKLKHSEERLAELQATSVGSEIESTSKATDSKITDLKNQILACKNESINLKEHLSKARNATAQYKKLADAAEKQVFDSNAASKQLQNSLMQQIQQLKNEITRLQTIMQQHEKEKEDIKNSAAAANKELETANATQEVHQLRQELSSSNALLSEASQEVQSLRQAMEIKQVEFQKQENIAIDLQNRYERELTNHGQTTQNVIQLREQISCHNQIVNDLSEAKRKAEMDVTKFQEEANLAQQTLKEEYKLLNEQFEVVEANNKALYNQLTNISHQMTTLRDNRDQSGLDDSQLNRSLNTSVPGTDNAEESATTIEQFMDIIKYLRKEKEILSGKVEVVNAECTRIKAQFEASSNQLNESQSALQFANEKINSSMMPSTRFDDLMEKVQTIPALKDSNRVLREENNKFSVTIDQLQNELAVAKSTIDPLKAQLSSHEEVQDRQKSEISALMADNQKWRNRVTGLIEKHQKINPEEMKKIQIQNSQLNKQNMTLQNQFKQVTAKHSEEIANAKRELEMNKSSLSSKIQDLEKQKAEIQSRANEDLASVKKDHDTKLATKIQELEKKSVESQKKSVDIGKLKQLGRNLQEKNKKFEVEVTSLKETIKQKDSEIQGLKNDAQQAATSGEGGVDSESQQKLTEAELLIEESARNITELETEKGNLIKEQEELVEKLSQKDEELKELEEKCTKIQQKEERAKNVLINAKEQITKVKQENATLKGQLQSTPDNVRKENVQLKQNIANLTQELQSNKDNFENEKQHLIAEHQKQLQHFRESKLEQNRDQPGLPGESKSQANVTASVKPVMATSGMTGASSTSQGGQRKQSAVQPQAHITPLTRQPHMSAQTATIRPTAMRTSNVLRSQQGPSNSPVASASTSDMTAGPSNVPQVSVQPTLVSVVGPTSSNAPSTSASGSGHRLNPLAPDFISRSSVVTAGSSSPATSSTNIVSQQQVDPSNIEPLEEQLPQGHIQASSQSHRPGQKAAAMVQPRQSSEDSSVAGPSPSTSSAAMVSVAPKRRRDEPETPFSDGQKKLRQEAVASTVNVNEGLGIAGTSRGIASPSTPSRKPKIAEVSTSSAVQGEDDIVVIDSNSSNGDEQDIDDEEEQNDVRDNVEDDEENDDEEDTNVDDEEEEEEGEYIEDARDNMELEDNDQDESDIQEEEGQEEKEGTGDEEEDEDMDDNNEENEAESVGQDPQADLSEGEVVDEEAVQDNSDVAQAVEAAMVAARRQVQENREEDVVNLESSEDDEEGIDDGNDEEGDTEDPRHTSRQNVGAQDEEDPEEVMEDVVEDQESSHLQYPEQSDNQHATASASREAMSDTGGNSVVPEFGEMIASSSQRVPGESVPIGGIPQYQRHAVESSSSVAASRSQHGQEAHGSSQFEDGKDDSVVPSTPKLGDGILHSSRGVPGSSSSVLGSSNVGARPFEGVAANTFVFSSHAGNRGEGAGASNVSSSSNRSTFDISSGVSGTVPDLALQHGLDRTSVDFAQFTANAAQGGQQAASGPSQSNAPALVVPSESQPLSDVGSSEGDGLLVQDPQEISTGQQPPQQGQSSEVVTSSSSLANTSGAQAAPETSSSVTQAMQQQLPRGSPVNRGQRRGIQRQPIVWDAASTRSQGAPSLPLAAARGMHPARQQRGGPRSRRPGRGNFTRRGPRGAGT